MICIGFLLKIPQYQRFDTFFSDFTPFFHTSFKILLHFIICLLKCYTNIYGLHRFSIGNSFKLAISHLFQRFHTFSSHLFQNFVSLRTPPHSYQSIEKKSRSIPTTVLKFWVGTRFCDTDKRTNERRTTNERTTMTNERTTMTTPLRITIP